MLLIRSSLLFVAVNFIETSSHKGKVLIKWSGLMLAGIA